MKVNLVRAPSSLFFFLFGSFAAKAQDNGSVAVRKFELAAESYDQHV